jgi:hypothetical protein
MVENAVNQANAPIRKIAARVNSLSCLLWCSSFSHSSLIICNAAMVLHSSSKSSHL